MTRSVAVNISARNLLDVDFVSAVPAILDAVGLPHELLTLEVTESSIVHDPARTMHALETLGATGIRVSIDDFGTGYSSLTLLKQLPVHEIKIDQSFVRALDTDAGDRAIVRSVVQLGADLGLSVVAEGVETGTVLEVLRSFGCDKAQGYLISRPIPNQDFVALHEQLLIPAPLVLLKAV